MDKVADLLGPTPYPGETPQAEADSQQENSAMSMPDVRPDYSVAPTRPADEYQWSMSGTHVAVSNDDHGAQFQAMQWNDFDRPHAYGKVELHYRWQVYWHVYYTNMSLPLVERRLKRYTKDQGWEWGGMLDEEGMPIQLRAIRESSVPGIGEINPGLMNWHRDEWNDMETFDSPAPESNETPYYGIQDYQETNKPDSPRTCSECGALLLNYDDWRKHILRDHLNPDRKPPADPQPVVDLDDVLPAHFDKDMMDSTVQRQSRLIFQLTAARTQAPLIPGPMPFIYDIESDRIFVGHPGERHSDIQGRFTPGGIIEGLYDPKGSVQIRTDTDMPYTVRHMAELWYAMHPELQIKSIYLMVGEKKYKLASANIGHQVRNLVATDPAAWSVFQALEPIGNVYAVGGVVRDVVLGKTPKDIDLMVQGVEPEEVEDALKTLPGRVDYTGKQFGVFRYRDPEGNEVEVALPRTERSTGPGHRDFEVYTSPYISVGEDLARRDFTGNAMAVNLATGDLVDPYHGSEHLKSGTLQTVSDRSFLEDPLRILRAFGSVSRHGLEPSPETYHDLAAHGHLLGELPQERLQMELDKLMSGSDPAKAIDLMEQTGVLQHVLPEVAATTGFDQKSKYHAHLLSDHLKEVLRAVAAETGDVDVRWAALLHDIGKPGSQWFDDEGYGHYYENEQGQGADHEVLGAEMAQKLLTELKFPNDRIARIVHLIRHHMFPSFSSTAGARKFLNRVGGDHAEDLLTLREADAGGKGNLHDGNVPLMRQYIQAVRDAGEPTNTKMLAINGNDLIAAGFKPGPEMGALLKHLTDLVLEDPSLNEKETLLNLAVSSRDELPDAVNGRIEATTKTAKTANILDPIKDNLDPDVFNNAEALDPQVKPKIIEFVKKKIYKTMVGAGWPDPSKYLTLILTGSLTTYQWSEQSDFDISLWVDVERFPEWVRADLIAMMIDNCDGTIVPGTTHPMQCFVVDPNKFKPSDLYKPGLRSGYNLDDHKWVVLPEKERSIDVSKRWPEHIAYAKMCVDKMKMMLRYDKYAVKTYWDFLHRQRFLDQRAGKGDYALSNIVYKMLANEGLLDEISEATGQYIA